MAKTDLSKLSWRDARVALKQARLDRGWTQVDLAEATDYTKGRISQEEKGSDKSIPFKYLDRVIPALGFDSLQNLLDKKHRKFVIPLAQRSTVAAPKRDTKEQVLESMVYEALEPVRQHRSLMKKLASRDPVLPLMRMPNPLTREVATQQGQEAARRFRDFLGVSSNSPLMDLGRILGRLGIAIRGCDLPEGIQGVIVGNPDHGFAILYSRSDQAKRQLFTVAHELGHLVMDTLPYVEKRAKKPHPTSSKTKKRPSPPRERRANALQGAKCNDECRRRRQRAQQQCGARGKQHRWDEPAAVQDVAERHEQQYADGEPDLCRGDEPTGGRGGDAQVARDEAEQRLRPVQVGDGRPRH
ncbi:ImmA/IrrE family metallo-endopeptidase, partial [bacterium]|nr:ImmA/IrrE family metallo-endopeptidase [bacterium]